MAHLQPNDESKQLDMGETETDRVSGALEREDWSLIIEMASDPATSKAVTSATVGFGGGTALHMTSYCHNLDVSKVLLDNGADMTAKDREGYTPLHIAALSGSHSVAELLISRGARVSAVNAYGWTPLHAASVNGHAEVGQLLLDNGAKPDAEAADGRTPELVAFTAEHLKMAEVLKVATRRIRWAKTRRRIVIDEDDESNEAVAGQKENRGLEKKHSGISSSGEEDKNMKDNSESGYGKLTTARAGAQPPMKKTKLPLPQQRGGWESESISPKLIESEGHELSPGVGCPKGPYKSPVGILRGVSSFENHAQVKTRFEAEKERAEKNDAHPSLLSPPFLPARVGNVKGSEYKHMGAFEYLGRLSVAQVAKMMANYVWEGQDSSTSDVFQAKIQAGVKAYRLSGRALLSREPAASDLARTILLERTTVEGDAPGFRVPKDVLFYSVVDFIRVCRLQVPSTHGSPAVAVPAASIGLK